MFFSLLCSYSALLIGFGLFLFSLFCDDDDNVSCSCCILDCSGLDLTMDIEGIITKKHEAMSI